MRSRTEMLWRTAICAQRLLVLSICSAVALAQLRAIAYQLNHGLKSLILGELAEWLRSGLQKVPLTLKLEKISNIIKGLS